MRKLTTVIGIIIVVFLACTLYAGCSQNLSNKEAVEVTSVKDSTYKTAGASKNGVTQDEIDRIEFKDELIQGNVTPAMSLVKISKIDLDGKSATIELYVDMNVDNESEKQVLDDGQLWSLLVREDDLVYPLIHKQYIQMGEINYWVYGTTGEREGSELVIYTSLEQSAGFSMKEFVFIPDELIFVKNDVVFTDLIESSLIDKSENAQK